MPQEKWISEKLRPVEMITKPAFSAPPKSCDCHMHVFGRAEAYPGIAEARYTLPEGSLAQYEAVARLFGLERAVFVQPSYYGTDNSCLLDAMLAFKNPCRGVVFLPQRIAPALIATLHRQGVRGIRLDFFKADEAGAGRQDIQGQLLRTAQIARDAGWHIELYSPGHVIAALLDDLAGLEVDFSVNHMGYMKREYGLTDKDFEHFVELTRTPHCWVKLTGPYRVAPDDQKERTDWMARTLIAAAPERMLWGTDWPHLPHGSRDTGELFNRLLAWCPDETMRYAILVKNPTRLYQFD